MAFYVKLPLQATKLVGESSSGSPIDILATEKGSLAVGNGLKKFRDNFFIAAPDLTVWDQSWTNQDKSYVMRGGNSSGSGYLQISLSPFTAGSEYTLLSKETFKYPTKLFIGASASQRILGQELEISLVGLDSTNAVETIAAIPDMAISGTVSVTANVATVNFATNHPYFGGDRVILKGNTDSRLNVGPVVVTIISKTQITVPVSSIVSGTITAGGFVEFVDQGVRAKNVGGILYDTASVTTASFFSRRNGSSVRTSAATISTTTAIQTNTSAYSDSFNAASFNELYYNMQELALAPKTSDTASIGSTTLKYTNTIPDEELSYKIRIRAKTLNNFTVPVAKIVSIAKTGTTTATVTTDVAHNLNTTSYVQIYGVRDQTNFPNLTASTVVSSIVSPTSFTIVIGTATTTNSTGGVVFLNNGGTLAPGALGVSIQSISRTNNVFSVTMSTSSAVPLPGELYEIRGCDATSMGLYDGAYRVLRANATILELESIDSPTGVDFGSINCGGALIKRTDYRIHFIQCLEYTRHLVELFNQGVGADGSRALPVVSTTGSIVTTVTTVSNITTSNAGLPIAVADVASAALTTTTTTTAITPTSGVAYKVQIPVTAVTGTNPTLDFSIEESLDTGTNWIRIYDFPRITATGSYTSPVLPLTGNRIRYVQTVGGSTPSFTRAVNRLTSTWNSDEKIKQIFDRTIVLTTLNSTTAVLAAEGTKNIQMVVNVGAITTTAPQLTLQASEDNLNWFDVDTALTAVASSTVQKTVNNFSAKFIRVRVSTAGVGVTAGYIVVKAF